MGNKSTILVALLVLAALVGGFYFYNRSLTSGEETICTMEAKICPDGSSVGRTGPNCQFAPCPSAGTGNADKEQLTASLGQRILNKGLYITPLELVSDSRCPTSTQCIWAGEVTLKVKLEKGATSKEVTLKSDTPMTFEGEKITLSQVAPAKSKSEIGTSDYRFTFTVTSAAPAGQNEPAATTPAAKSLTGKTWVWASATYKGEAVKPLQADRFKLTVKTDGTFSASTDCNGVGGEYELSGSKISFVRMMSTLMYCEGSQESVFSNMMSEVTSYQINGSGELVLSLKSGGSMVFK